jgi:hypothetical protein
MKTGVCIAADISATCFWWTEEVQRTHTMTISQSIKYGGGKQITCRFWNVESSPILGKVQRAA